MAGTFDLGAAKAKIFFDDSQYTKGVKTVKGQNAGMTKGFKKRYLESYHNLFNLLKGWEKEIVFSANAFGSISLKRVLVNLFECVGVG